MSATLNDDSRLVLFTSARRFLLSGVAVRASTLWLSGTSDDDVDATWWCGYRRDSTELSLQLLVLSNVSSAQSLPLSSSLTVPLSLWTFTDMAVYFTSSPMTIVLPQEFTSQTQSPAVHGYCSIQISSWSNYDRATSCQRRSYKLWTNHRSVQAGCGRGGHFLRVQPALLMSRDGRVWPALITDHAVSKQLYRKSIGLMLIGRGP